MQETLCTSHEFVLVFMQIKSEVENIVPMNDQALTSALSLALFLSLSLPLSLSISLSLSLRNGVYS